MRTLLRRFAPLPERPTPASLPDHRTRGNQFASDNAHVYRHRRFDPDALASYGPKLTNLMGRRRQAPKVSVRHRRSLPCRQKKHSQQGAWV